MPQRKSATWQGYHGINVPRGKGTTGCMVPHGKGVTEYERHKVRVP